MSGLFGYISVSSVTATYGSALTAAHFWKGRKPAQPKVSKRPSPQHSAPRLGSVCPHSCLNPWAAAMGHPWPSAANPASCRVTHAPKPAFGQRGFTGRRRSKARSKATRFASWIRFSSSVGAGLPAKNVRPLRSFWFAASSLTTIAGKPAPTRPRLPLPLLHTTQAGCQAAVLLLLILILGAPSNTLAERRLESVGNPAGRRVSRAGPRMAHRGGPRIQAGVRACRA